MKNNNHLLDCDCEDCIEQIYEGEVIKYNVCPSCEQLSTLLDDGVCLSCLCYNGTSKEEIYRQLDRIQERKETGRSI